MAPTRKASTRRRALDVAATAESPSATFKRALSENAARRRVLREHVAAEASRTQRFAGVARAAFKDWEPTAFSRAERVALNYVREGESVSQALKGVVAKGMDKLLAAGGKSLRIAKADALGEALDSAGVDAGAGGLTMGTVAVGVLLEILKVKFQTPTLRDEPAMTVCDVKAETERRMNQIEGKPPATPPATPPAAPDPAGGNDGNGADPQSLQTKSFIKKQVNTLLGTITSPEERVTVGLPRRDEIQRQELAGVASAVQTFELRAGASDVTSYHDFSSLQIAFEHVWTEIFDGRLKGLGEQLYQAYVEHLDFLNFKSDPKRNVTSIDDIQGLLEDVRKLTNVAPTTKLFDDFGSKLGNLGTKGVNVSVLIGNPGSTTSTTTGASDAEEAASISGAARLTALLNEVEAILRRPYAFHVFKEKAINFGIMVTYRQTWRPESYQVGDLVSTIPLAPREVRRYTTKRVSKKTRAQKELEDNLRTTKTEVDSTSRVEREILNRAEQKTNFNLTAHESFGGDNGFKIDATQQGGGDQSQLSADTKKNFHEAVLKSAQEYRQQNRMEIDTSSSVESEDTTFHEIQNPNDELTVTYLFYELQRTYRVSERIHRVTPVILVANPVPLPDAIDDAWLVRHDWILRRVILDDSFRPALDYLTTSFVGAELNIQLLDNAAKAQKQVVDQIKAQVEVQTSLIERNQRELADQVKTEAGVQIGGSILNTVKRVFDPLQITGDAAGKTVEGVQTLVEFARQSLDRAEREKARLLDQLGVANTALQAAIDKLSAAIKEHFDRVAEIDRLQIHVKENILYYLQAIWNHEPPDQRFFRIYTTPVPVIEPVDPNANLTVSSSPDDLFNALFGNKFMNVMLSAANLQVTTKQLVEVADLDNVLGYKGNYAIYRLKENNYLTLHMMQDYLTLSDVLEVRDPDDFANYTVDELQRLAQCLFKNDRDAYTRHKEEIRKLITDRITSGRSEDDRVIVPTSSLYIEALVGTHPLLEDFKLLHRAIDVKKVQGEVRHAELENVRLSARALEGIYGDPDIEKKVIVEGSGNSVAVLPDA